MKYFYDTEFSERGPNHPIELISIGIVCEDGREMYAVSRDFDYRGCNDWVREHVLPKLPPPKEWLPRQEIAELVAKFLRAYFVTELVELWAYYCAYDHVVLAQLFDTMDKMPSAIPYWTHDLMQLWESKGRPRWPDKPGSSKEHNALEDARWCKKAYDKLMAVGV